MLTCVLSLRVSTTPFQTLDTAICLPYPTQLPFQSNNLPFYYQVGMQKFSFRQCLILLSTREEDIMK